MKAGINRRQQGERPIQGGVFTPKSLIRSAANP